VLEELQRTAEIEEERRAAEAAKREQAKVRTVPSLPPISEDRQTDRFRSEDRLSFSPLRERPNQTQPALCYSVVDRQVAEDELRQAEEAEAEAARR
jgi:hypothetical protein